MRIVTGSSLLIITLVLAIGVSLFFGIDSVYTQIFYIPIILVGLFNFRRAVYVALLFGCVQVFLGIFLIQVSHEDVSMIDQIIRGAMYILVAFVVGTLSERQDTLLNRVKESEEKYRFIATSIDDGIVALDLQGRLTYANPRTYALTGFRPGESAGQPMSAILSPQNRQEIDQAIKEVLAGGKPIVRDLGFETRDGKRRTFSFNTSTLRDSEGKITGIVAAFRDVTEHRQTQAALERSRDLYLALMESFPGLIWRTGPDGKGSYFNRNWLDFTGREAEQEMGEGWLAGVHEQDREPRAKALREASGDRKAFESEYRLKRKDGSYRWMLEAARPFFDADGSFAGLIGFAYDNTERKEAAEELRGRNRELGLLNSISSGINRSQDMPGLLYSVLTDVMDLLQVPAGAVYLADGRRPGQMTLRASLPYAAAGQPERFRPAFIPDVRVDPGKVWTTEDRRAGCIAAPSGGTVAIVPVAARSRLVGLMAFYAGGSAERLAAESTAAQLLSVGSQLGIAVENQELFGQLKETSQHLSDVIEESPDAVLTTDPAGVVRSFNRSAARLLKYAPEEVVGRHLSVLLPPGASVRLEAARSHVREFRCRDGAPISLNISAARLARAGANDGFIVTLKDLSGIAGLKIVPITERAAASDQAYHFDKGVIYLVDKRKIGHSMDIFADQVLHNIQGLCITRQSPPAIRERYGLERTPLVWLNGGEAAPGETTIKPGNLASLTATVADFVAKAGDGVVMLDGMEYLLARNGFDALLKFVQYLNDRITDSDSRAFFCIDSGAVDDKQWHLLLTETIELKEQPYDYPDIPEKRPA